LVEHWSPKPGVGSSSLSTRANKRIMNIVSYIKESFSELKEHVSWTALPELSNLTVIVLVFSLIFAGLIWLADSVLSRIVKLYFDFIN
jgi:preprotein translocase subunit SecE